MQETTYGIVVRTIKYGDNSHIVDIYTPTRGLVTFMVRQPKSRKSPIKTIHLRPLTNLQINYDHRPTENMQHLTDIHLTTPYQTIPYNPYKTAITLFLSEFLSHILKHETPQKELYQYITYSMQWLDTAKQAYSNFHLVFITRLTRFLGFYPNTTNKKKGYYFDLLNACFTPTPPTHTAFLQPAEAALIPLFMRMNYNTMQLFPMNATQRNRYITILNHYYSLHLPNFPNLKSPDILRELFV